MLSNAGSLKFVYANASVRIPIITQYLFEVQQHSPEITRLELHCQTHTHKHLPCNLQPIICADAKSVNHATCERDIKQKPLCQRARKYRQRLTSPEGIQTSNIKRLCLI